MDIAEKTHKPSLRMTQMQRAVLLLLALSGAWLRPSTAATANGWRSRTIYQTITDRFARADCWGEHCDDLNHYCGGTFAGLQKMSGYIQEMGFDAVWWSPVTLQGSDTEGSSGYHGYWPSDLYKVNPAFGTKEDLKALVRHYQNQGMFVLFDMVINHMGYGDVSTFNPFNNPSDYHDCDGCLGIYCDADPAWLSGSPGGAWSNEHCKISGLPDLNHSDPTVANRLISWFNYTQETYSPDGFRLDAAGHSLLDLCVKLNKAVEPFTVGELFLADSNSTTMDIMTDFLEKGGADGAFAFPMQVALEKVFREYGKHDLVWLAERRADWVNRLGPKVHDMFMFTDNHDVPRWLHANYSSVHRFQNALTYVLFMEGIPVIYYGTEQGFTDPQLHPPRADPRAPLWASHYQHDHPLWLFLKTAIAYRKEAAIWDAGLAVQHHVDPHYLVLSRGQFVITLTDVGEDGPPAGYGDVHMVGDLPERFWGKSLQNIFSPEDVLSVSANGVGLYKPDSTGKPQVFYMGKVAHPLSFYNLGPKVYDSSSTAVFIIFVVILALLLLVLGVMHLWTLKYQPETLQHCCCCDMVARKAASTSAASPYRQSSLSHSLTAPRSLRSDAIMSFQGCTQDHSLMFAKPRSIASGMSGSYLAALRGLSIGSKPSSASLAAVTDPMAQGLPGAMELAVPPAISNMEDDLETGKLALQAEDTKVTSLYSSCKSTADSTAIKGCDGTSSSPFALAAAQMTVLPGSKSPSCFTTGSSSFGASSSASSCMAAGRATAGSSGASAGPHGQGSASTAGLSKSASRTGVPPDAVSRGKSFNSATGPITGSASGSSVFVQHGGVAGENSQLGRQSTVSQASLCHVALEYSIPSLGFTNQLMYGGMGLVVDTFIKHWPGPMGLIAPLYEPCYSPPPAWFQTPDAPAPSGATASASCQASGGGEAHGASAQVEQPIDRPTFIPADQKPLVSLTVDSLEGQLLPVQVFKYEVQENGHPRVYYLVQSDVFRCRDRSHMYNFENEDEMLTWLAVFNKAVAAVVTTEGITHLQLHDCHAGLSLLFMPEHLRPAVMYVAHNAHYDATFPVPTADRRLKVYAALNLNSKLSAPLVEHNGNLDVLRSVVMYMRQQQEGKGVVAVSPRYAEQVCDKLSVFWQLSTLGRPNTITGILNSLDMADSLAASGLSLSQVLAVKNTAKLKLQRQYGLAVGQQYTVMTFVGRMTQQKGCDIIADAAADIMAKHPQLQMVVVGPTGDPVGNAAISKLHDISQQYPDRMYCPIDHYVSGTEKEMLLQATDFCMLPSRFEPCGLVDVEFGWNGALTIGHDTGGLGKMPGVYFTAQASHLSHLSRKFEAAVCKALSLSLTDRHGLAAEALARRFPVDAMMSKYQQAWLQIDNSYQQAKAAAYSKQIRQSFQQEFFAKRWERCNKGTSQTSKQADNNRPLPDGAAHATDQSSSIPVQAASSISAASPAAGLDISRCSSSTLSWSDLVCSFRIPRADAAPESATPLAASGGSRTTAAGRQASDGCQSRTGSTEYQQGSVATPAAPTAAPGSRCGTVACPPGPAADPDSPSGDSVISFDPCCVSACCLCGGGGSGCSAAVARPPRWLQASREAYKFSNYLLVVLQYLAMGPGMLLLTFLLLNDVAIKFSGNRCGLHLAPDWLMPASADVLTTSVITFFAISTGFTPVWFMLAAKTRPVVYIRMSALLTFLSYSLTFLALYTHQTFTLVLGFAAATNMVASPILSQGLLGEEDVDVFEVGRIFLALSEGVRYSLLCACMAMAAAAAGPVPHQMLAGLCMLASAVMMVWFCMPNSLHRAYEHMCFSFKGQWKMLTHISCFWLSLVCSTCDSLLLLINGYLVVTTTHSLEVLAGYQAVAFGACGVAVLLNCKLLCSRAAELRLNAVVMMLAAMPFYMLLKALVVMTPTSLVVLFVSSGVIDVVMGGRSSILGLAGFVTLPSREVVCIWQFAAILLGSAGALITVGSGYAAQLSGYSPSNWLLVGIIGGLELLRLVCVIVMARIYPRENLSAP